MIQKYKYQLIIILCAALFYIPFTGRVHLFDWDEINFAESAREMIETGDYLTVQINYKAFWEKPPLFIWMQALSMKIFGVNEFAARFPNAICGIISLLLLFHIGKQLKNTRFAFFWVLSFGASVLPFLYFKSGIIDPWFNLFIFSGLHFFILFYQLKKEIFLYLSAFTIGLAVLTKGPAGFLIYGLTIFIFLILNRFNIKFTFKQILLYILFFAISGGFWFILQILSGNWTVIQDFIVYQIRLFKTQDAGHGGFLLYHFVVLLIGVFPASFFALPVLIKKSSPDDELAYYTQWMKILFWVVLILFTIVRTKIVHYSSMCYLPLSFLSAKFISDWMDKKRKIPVLIQIVFFILVILFVAIGIGLPLLGMNTNAIIDSGIIRDKFVNSNLTANVPWSGFEMLITLALVTGIIIYLACQKNKLIAVPSLFAGVLVFTYLFLLINIGKIEGYSQRAVIEFYKSKEHEECYIHTVRFKSYAPFFYKKIKVPDNPDIHYNYNTLLYGEIDKTAYFVTRVHRKSKFENEAPEDLIFIEDKNGYSFFKREKTTND